ncbi:unannotated protein [freshwater metagenome]|uniref:pantoate--beta-alanine ligase (AMP-forming) n=1 Tax=freshwater metagenome TaxID=449393 RepID=A0A6J5YVW0_9ZZZZ|nr:pantoate--beta-alanine ligase [Actinomycetota bacterium]MSW24259.1 pantoate--beta-alanine ligase [Actinomycetota bacterium]MSX29125.1 pantoate--beta-alanine ligase [Actinomycetota bacterium]MSX43028.1 pantoate--beta-alanine ligase [Actinomycetota bacterium]MSX97293.1 pantoate--beta-alanine ligase [Actinomycetota bacterium]
MSSLKLLTTVGDVQSWNNSEATPVAAVLTMGALHRGHAELITHAKANTPPGTRVIATIFVNPTQFNSASDLDQYPRSLDADLALLKAAGADAVFVPDVGQIYPAGLKVNPPMEPGALGEILEGNARPGHFRGMLTVVHRLFEILDADYSFFGEKDFQQLALVKEMVTELAMPIEIFGVPTVRDESGLALSSRNRRLSSSGLELAQHIPVVMELMSQAFTSGESARECEQVGREYLLGQGIASIEYLEIRASDLISPPVPANARIFIAVVIEDIRLIDNLEIAK